MKNNPYTSIGNKKKPQNQPLFGKKQILNNAGGYVFELDSKNLMMRLKRFLILGSAAGTYYVNAYKLTKENANFVNRCLSECPQQTFREMITISQSGLAPKPGPCLLALAIAFAHENEKVRSMAVSHFNKIVRIGTHLFEFLNYLKQFRGIGTYPKKAISSWYNDKDAGQLEYQMIKYQNREGWSHSDVLRFFHPHPATAKHDRLFYWALKRKYKEGGRLDDFPLIESSRICNETKDVKQVINEIRRHGLTHEMIGSQWRKEPEVWSALVEKIPYRSLVRNVSTMTRIGLAKPLSWSVDWICSKLTNLTVIQKSRIHPFNILIALMTYQRGYSRTGGSYVPVPQIIDALEQAYYLSFTNVEPTGKRILLALDVSGSMEHEAIQGLGINACEASIAMAMVTARIEPNYHIVGFESKLVPLPITKNTMLFDALKIVRDRNFGATDCAQPMIYALENNLEVDAFCVYTDNETWCGWMHPTQALKKYRDKFNINSKLVVCGMTATDFSIADPEDINSLDVVGCDSSTPSVISQFISS